MHNNRMNRSIECFFFSVLCDCSQKCRISLMGTCLLQILGLRLCCLCCTLSVNLLAVCDIFFPVSERALLFFLMIPDIFFFHHKSFVLYNFFLKMFALLWRAARLESFVFNGWQAEVGLPLLSCLYIRISSKFKMWLHLCTFLPQFLLGVLSIS